MYRVRLLAYRFIRSDRPPVRLAGKRRNYGRNVEIRLRADVRTARKREPTVVLETRKVRCYGPIPRACAETKTKNPRYSAETKLNSVRRRAPFRIK